MRLDKFIWFVRKYKTRSIATEAVRKERVSVNNETSKPSREVKPGDEIEFKKEGVSYKILVKDLPKSRIGAKLVDDYITDITPPEELEKQNFIRLMQNFNRERGSGRPTKKDRRDMDDFTRD